MKCSMEGLRFHLDELKPKAFGSIDLGTRKRRTWFGVDYAILLPLSSLVHYLIVISAAEEVEPRYHC